MQNNVISVGIVEDEAELREGFAFLVDRTPALALAGVCEYGEEAVRRFGVECPAVVLMDVQLPGMTGIECIRQLRERVRRRSSSC